MGKRSECDISYLADQVEGIVAGGPQARAQQQLLLEVVEEQLAESRSAGVARDVIASLIGLSVHLRSALGLREAVAPAPRGRPPLLPIKRVAG